jgi:hypothetical protein
MEVLFYMIWVIHSNLIGWMVERLVFGMMSILITESMLSTIKALKEF